MLNDCENKKWLNQLKVGDSVVLVVQDYIGHNCIRVDKIVRKNEFIKLDNHYMNFSSETGKSVFLNNYYQIKVVEGKETDKGTLYPVNPKFAFIVQKLNDVLFMLEKSQHDSYLERLFDRFPPECRELFETYGSRCSSIKTLGIQINNEEHYKSRLEFLQEQIYEIDIEIKQRAEQVKSIKPSHLGECYSSMDFYHNRISYLNKQKQDYISEIRSIRQAQIVGFDKEFAEETWKNLRNEISDIFSKIVKIVLELR